MVVWVGIHKGGKTSLVAQRLHVAGYSGKPLPSTPKKNLWKQHSAARRLRLPMHTWLLQCKNFLKRMGRC